MLSLRHPLVVRTLLGVALAWSLVAGAQAATGVFAPIPTISPTTTLAAGHVCYTDGRDIACDTNGPTLSGLGMNDRIVSSTQGLIINGSTGYVSLTVAGSTVAYLAPSGYSYLPFLNTLGVSATGTISASQLTVLQNTGTAYGILVNAVGAQNPNFAFAVNGAPKFNYGYDIAGGYFKIAESFVADRFAIQNGTGNVGIGTTLPSTTLHVSGTVMMSDSGAACNATTNILGAIKYASGQFYVCRNATTGWEALTAGGNGTAQTDRITSGTDAVVVNGSTHTVSFTTNGVVAGYIDGVGNHIVPGVSATGTVSATNGYFYSQVNVGPAGGKFNIRNDGVNSAWNNSTGVSLFYNIVGVADNSPAYRWYTTASDTFAMTILNNGNVGIGTAAPGAALEVSPGSLIIDKNGAQGGQIGFGAQTGYDGWSQYSIGNVMRFLTTSANSDTLQVLNSGGGVADLDVQGHVKLGDSKKTCDGSSLGAIRFTGGQFSVCRTVGVGWENLGAAVSGTSVGVTAFASLTDVSVSTSGGNMFAANTLSGTTGGATQDTAFGNGALSATGNSGLGNAAFGNNALNKTTTGNYNVAAGLAALALNTTGALNSAFGAGALQNNVAGSSNVAMGQSALFYSTASANTGLGYSAGSGLTSGASNTLIGAYVGSNLTTGSNNILIGYNVQPQTIADSNTLNIGNTIYGNTVSGRVGIGTASPSSTLQVANGDITLSAGYGITSVNGAAVRSGPAGNTFLVNGATTGVNGNIFGGRDVSSNTVFLFTSSGSLILGNGNITAGSASSSLQIINGEAQVASSGAACAAANAGAIRYATGALSYCNGTLWNTLTAASGTTAGVTALASLTDVSASVTNGTLMAGTITGAALAPLNTTSFGYGVLANASNSGLGNTAFGTNAMNANTTGNNSAAFGINALAGNTTGAGQAAFGGGALSANTTGTLNTAIGGAALHGNTTGSNNTALGKNALLVASTAGDNTSLGYQSGYYVTTGSSNTLVGWQAGSGLTTGSNNIMIGYNVQPQTNADSNTLNIGNLAYGNLNQGFFGINNPAPSVALEVSGSISRLTYSSNEGPSLFLRNPKKVSTGQATNWAMYNMTGLYGDSLQFWSYPFGGSPSNRLALMDNGTIGIGTSTPASSLTILAGEVQTASSGAACATTNAGAIRYAGAALSYCNGTIWANLAASASGTSAGVSTFASLTDVSVSAAGGNMMAANTLSGTTSGATNDTAFGVGALTAAANAGASNSAFGHNALNLNTVGTANTAVGNNALLNDTSGGYNSAIGAGSSKAITTGSYNAGLGVASLGNIVAGTNNVGVGAFSGNGATGAVVSNSTFVGAYAGYGLTTGSDNTMLGYQSGYYVTTGSSNTLIGWNAGSGLTTGSNNILIGYNVQPQTAADSNTLNIGNTIYGTGIGLGTSGNVGIGISTPTTQLDVKGSTTDTRIRVRNSTAGGDLFVSNGAFSMGSYNSATVFIANNSEGMRLYVGGSLGIGTSSTMPGSSLTVAAGEVQTASSGAACATANAGAIRYTTGALSYCNGTIWNTLTAASGTTAGVTAFASLTDVSVSGPAGNMINVHSLAGVNTGVHDTTAFGAAALSAVGNTGYYNAAFGTNALLTNTTGYQNLAVGSYALRANTTGFNNTSVGAGAMSQNTTGIDNVALGEQTMYGLTSGSANTALGLQSGAALTSGSSNTLVGIFAGNNLTSGSNNIIIGYNIQAQTAADSNTLNIGNTIYGNLATGNVGIGTSSIPSNARLIVTAADNVTPKILFTAYGSTVNGNLQFQRAQGTSAAPSALLTDDGLGGITNIGYGATGYSGASRAAIIFRSVENWTDAAQGTYIQFLTTNPSTTVQSEKLRITASGALGIGTGTPASSLTVVGEAQVASSGAACAATNAGAIRYASNTLSFCNGTAWTSTGSGGSSATTVTALASLTTDVSVSAAAGNMLAATQTTGWNAGIASSTAFGFGALSASGNSGFKNSAFGAVALSSNTTGFNNTGLGFSALTSNVTGQDNIGVGTNSMRANASGSYNTAVGYQAGYGNSGTPGSINNSTLIGAQTAFNLTTGGENTALGFQAGYNLTTGSSNTLIGLQAGSGLTTGSNNILIGYNVQPATFADNNTLNIGNTIYGNLATGNVGIGGPATAVGLTISATATVGSNMSIKSAGGAASYGLSYTGAGGTLGLAVGGAQFSDSSAMNDVILRSGIAGGVGGNLILSERTVTGSLIFTTGFPDTEKMRMTTSGSLGIGTPTPASSLTVVAGEIQTASSGAACTTANAGAIRYATGAITYCNGSAWTSVGGSGSTSSTYGTSGTTTMFPNFPDAIYCTDPAGNSNGLILYEGDTDDNKDGTHVHAYQSQFTTAIYMKFSSTGTEVAEGGVAAGGAWPCPNTTTIAGLYANGQAFNFIGGSGSGSGLSTTALASLTTDVSVSTTAKNMFAATLLTGANAGTGNDTAFGYAALSNAGNAGTNNSAFGSQALLNNTTGNSNTGLGVNALQFNTTGSFNLAAGQAALKNNLTGSNNVGLGYQAGYGATGTIANNSTLIGFQAGVSLTTGSDNTGVGFQSGYNLTTGSSNTLIGELAGSGLTTGSNNIMIGTNVQPQTNADSNTLNIGNTIFGVGFGSLPKLGIGTFAPSDTLHVMGSVRASFFKIGQGTAHQFYAADTSSTILQIGGPSNVYLGFLNRNGQPTIDGPGDSLAFSTLNVERMRITASGNLGIGTLTPYYSSLTVIGEAQVSSSGAPCVSTNAGAIRYAASTLQYCNASAWLNLAAAASGTSIGVSTFASLTDVSVSTAANNMFATNSLSGTLGTAPGNTAFGSNALSAPGNTGFGDNSAFGASALAANTTGTNNTALGFNAQLLNTTGNTNVAIGQAALRDNTAGISNVAIGYQAANGALGAYVNNSVWVGKAAGKSITTSSENTGVGFQSGNNLTTGSSNTLIGFSSGLNLTTGNNNIVIGSNVQAPAATSSGSINIGNTIYGNQGTNSIGIGSSSIPSSLTIVAGEAQVGSSGVTCTATNAGAIRYTASTLQYCNATAWLNISAAASGTTVGVTAFASLTDVSVSGPKGNMFNTHSLAGANSGVAYSTAYGYLALNSASNTGTNNTALGNAALYSNTTGSNNTAVGIAALQLNTTGNYNTGLGQSVLQNNTTGYQNVAVGVSALASNISGTNNVAVGPYAMQLNTGGASNVAMGLQALYTNTTGSNNTGLGTDALLYNTTGYQNTATGEGALQANTTGYLNTATGALTLYSNTTGLQNTAVGGQALELNTTGNYSTAVGATALYNNTTGANNTALGTASMYTNTTGTNNTGTGYGALQNNSTGGQNTASGVGALQNNSTGLYNTASGYATLQHSNANYNTAFGAQALTAVTTGGENTSMGLNSGYALTTGGSNTLIGNSAGSVLTTGSNNIMIGYSAQPLTATTNNQINIGGTIYGDQSTKRVGINNTNPGGQLEADSPAAGTSAVFGYNSTSGAQGLSGYANTGIQGIVSGTSGFAVGVYGVANGTQAAGAGGVNTVGGTSGYLGDNNGYGVFCAAGSCGGINAWTNTSDVRLKKNIVDLSYGLATIEKLRPVFYDWKHPVAGQQGRQVGLIAQEVEKVVPEVVSTAKDASQTKSIAYSSLVPVLIKSVQELKAENDGLKAQNDALAKRLDRLEQKMMLNTMTTPTHVSDASHEEGHTHWLHSAIQHSEELVYAFVKSTMEELSSLV